jgi:sRNA-binding regulator protein Hfq/DNA-binding XRE family transcriptional regulator
MSMLRSLRERKGLTVSQLAAKASIPSRVIIEYEEGRQTITLAHAKLLAKALWVGIEELMPPAGSVPPQPSAPTPSYAGTPAPQPRPQPVATQPAPHPGETSTVPRPATSMNSAQAPAAQPAYRPAPAQGQRPDASRGPQRAPGGAPPPRRTRPAPPPPGPITAGQVEELQRLAVKLDITQEQLEDRIGKKLDTMTRPEAKDWIKRARAMAEEIAPTRRVSFGKWPEAREDHEAAYLRAQQEEGAHFTFKLFNGEQLEGVITDFTPYTITIQAEGHNDDLVLRKLAIAYYRKGTGQASQETGATATADAAASATEPTAEVAAPVAAPSADGDAPAPAPAKKRTSRSAKAEAQAPAHDHATDDAHQPQESGVDSDRVGEPNLPEIDNMDEDRGV